MPALGECIVGELSDRLPENGGWLSGNLSIASIASRGRRILKPAATDFGVRVVLLE